MNSMEILGSAWVYNAHYVLGRLPDRRFWLAWRSEIAAVAYSMCYSAKQPELDRLLNSCG